MHKLLAFLGFISLLAGCATNPVTGRNEFSIVSEAQEQAIGAEQYGPSQQSQGGEYTVDEELTAYVSQVGQRLAAVSDRPLDYEFVVLNNSVPNAWALPGGKIAVNRGLLLELNNEAELAAVLGHEVVHAAARHGAQAMTRGTLLQGALTIGAFASRDNEYSDYLVGASQLGAQLISQRYGRDAERESDFYGTQYMLRAGYDPRAAISLQETFVRLSEGRATGWIDGLFASHPPSPERVENNRELVEQLMPQMAGRDLELGEARYQQAIAYLKETQPAYEMFDEAERAIADNDLDIALGNLEEAIRLVPQEARFSGLKGDIQLYQGNYRAAIDSYNEAIAKDDNYYDYYLGRGVAYSRQGLRDRAKTDLEHSASLLPTAVAMNELGKIALTDNDRLNAKQYFQSAAGAQGLVGQEAARAFIQIDLEDNPQNYVQIQPYVLDSGQLYGRVTNRSNVAIRNIRLDYIASVNGSIERRNGVINTLQAGEVIDLNTGLVFPAGVTPDASQINLSVVSAQAAN